MKLKHNSDPIPRRARAYLDLKEQLDAAMKGFAALRDQGFKLPKETLDWIDHHQAVKTAYPKDKK